MSQPDPRPALYQAYRQAITAAGAVRPDQLGAATPCPDFDLATLLDHLVFAGRRAAALGAGEPATMDDGWPHLELADVVAALREAAADAESDRSWGDPASLERTTAMPWGETYPGAALVGIYAVELATHAWDVAAATGRTGELDDRLGATVLAVARTGIKPEHRSEAGVPFGPEVAAPEGATAYQALAAFMGREPVLRA